jgi:hypothetical protein
MHALQSTYPSSHPCFGNHTSQEKRVSTRRPGPLGLPKVPPTCRYLQGGHHKRPTLRSRFGWVSHFLYIVPRGRKGVVGSHTCLLAPSACPASIPPRSGAQYPRPRRLPPYAARSLVAAAFWRGLEPGGYPSPLAGGKQICVHREGRCIPRQFRDRGGSRRPVPCAANKRPKTGATGGPFNWNISPG